MTDIDVDSQRPEPLKALIAEVSTFNGAFMGVLTALVSGGLISIQASNLVTALYGLIPGGLAIAATVLGAYALADAGRAEVTPLSDPMNNERQRLVPERLPPTKVTYSTTGGTYPPSTTYTAGGNATTIRPSE